ncbi:MAG: class I SAM-dependent methyltransferase [Pseudomonadota bacterium]
MHDEYQGMLALNYDALYGVMRDPSGDAAFYRSLAEAIGGPLLELGCGTGRVLLPIARLGIPCVGLDASPAMLSLLRAKNPPANLELVEGRMETLAQIPGLDGRQFRLITCPFRAFQHLLDVPAQLAALAGIHRRLASGGTFALDVFDPKLAWLIAPGGVERLDATFVRDGVVTRRFARTSVDLATQTMEISFRFEPDDGSGNSSVRLRWFTRYELEHLLARAGFVEVTVFGGYDQQPWRPEGDTVIVARRP